MLTLAAALCGCSASHVIDLYAADYRDTTANAGDAQLLLNILRAKDNVPIHFYDLSNIHGSIQWTAGAAASVPFVLNGSATPGTLAPLIGAQNNPTFDVGTSDTQDFTKGILSQIDPRIIKVLFDQGVDPRIIMLLFFSEYRAPGSNGRLFLNNFACDRSYPLKDGECKNRVYDYLHEIDNIIAARGKPQQLQANIYVVLSPVGGPLAGPWTLNNLDALRQLDATKFKLKDKKLYSISQPRLAICFERDHHLKALFDESSVANEACNKSEIIVDNPKDRTLSLPIRSTYEMLQFLGQVLRFQEEKGENRCLTLDPADRTCDGGEVLFQVNASVGTPVVATRYGNGWYALNNRNCSNIREGSCDYSLQVLAILELLLNANKAAKDIIATPRVQVVP